MSDEILKEFESLASSASFHFADDTTKEWQFGYEAQEAAIKLYKDNPELLPQMLDVMKRQLWYSTFLRVVEVWNAENQPAK